MFSKSNNNSNGCFIGFNGFDVTNKTSKRDWILCKKKQSADMDFSPAVSKGEVKSEAQLDFYLQLSYLLQVDDSKEKMRDSPALRNSGK